MGACILRGMAKLCQATLVWRVGPTVRGFVEGPHCLRHTTHTDKKELFATCCAPPKHTLLGLANPSCHLCRVNKGHVLTWPHVEGPLDPTTRPFCGRSLLDNRDSSTQKADIRTSTTHMHTSHNIVLTRTTRMRLTNGFAAVWALNKHSEHIQRGHGCVRTYLSDT
jgi:hypothetical protein